VDGGKDMFQYIGASSPHGEKWDEMMGWIWIGVRGEREGRGIGARRRSGGGTDGGAKRCVLAGVLVA
jgi:hypothetical protein